MIYRPPANRRMWDTWMLEEAGRYHLFTLTVPEGLNHWDRVCHAVSTDLLTWEDWDDIVLEDVRDPTAWDAGVILTGSVCRCADGFTMTYGAIRRDEDREKKGVQRIGLLFSKDLRVWEKCPGNPVLVPKGPHYEETPGETAESTIPWRDAYLVPSEDGFEAFICAGDPSKTRGVNGCVARAVSRDLIDWELMPPIASPERYVDMEVPQYFEWNGYHYILFSTAGGRVNTASRIATGGTYYLVSRSKYGEYQAPDDNMLIGSGDHRFDCYVGKALFADAEGPLLYHHICGNRPAFAAPKVLCQDVDGRLSVARWHGLDALLGDGVINAASPGAVAPAATGIPIGSWESSGERLVGDAGPAISAWTFAKPFTDGAVQAHCDLSNAVRGGVLFRLSPVDPSAPARRLRGLGVCLDRARGVIQLCEVRVGGRPSVQLKPLDTVHVDPGAQTDVEVFLRAEYIEVYCGGKPYFVLGTTDYPVEGQAGCFVDRGRIVAENLSVRSMPPLPQ